MAAVKHGTVSAYTNRKCRCVSCTEAMRTYQKGRRNARKAADRRKLLAQCCLCKNEPDELLAIEPLGAVCEGCFRQILADGLVRWPDLVTQHGHREQPIEPRITPLDARCGVSGCGEPQFDVEGHGVTCENGHGGAPSFEPVMVPDQYEPDEPIIDDDDPAVCFDRPPSDEPLEVSEEEDCPEVRAAKDHRRAIEELEQDYRDPYESDEPVRAVRTSLYAGPIDVDPQVGVDPADPDDPDDPVIWWSQDPSPRPRSRPRPHP